MAITILTSPDGLCPSGNPIQWTWSSDNTTQSNFSFFIEVYVNGVLYRTAQTFIEDSNKGRYNASDVAELVTSIPIRTSGESLTTADIYIIIYERFGSTITNQNPQTSSTIVAWKGKLDFNRWVSDWDVDDYLLNEADNNKLLTDAPYTSIRDGQSLNVYFLSDPNDAITVATRYFYKYYDKAGNLLDTTGFFTFGSENKYYRLSTLQVTYGDLVARYDGVGAFDNVDYATVQILYRNQIFDSSPFRINIDRKCVDQAFQIYFLTQLGGIDSFNFTRKGTYNMNSQQRDFKTNRGAWVDGVYTYDNTSTGQGNYQSKNVKLLTLQSDWIRQDVLEYLLDNLITSPYVLLDGKRVSIKSSTQEYKRHKFNPLFNLTIEATVSNELSTRV
jgi:hypothetical protein